MSDNSTKSLYFNGLAASLANLVVVSIYSLVAIRLSLKYLGSEEFGLLSLITQVSAYISLLDLGLSVAFSRILVDYKNGTKQHYANGLRTASILFHLLGFIGFLVASVIGIFGDTSLSIPHHLKKEFLILMIAQGATLFAVFSIKPISAPLIAVGKVYVVYWINVVLTLVNTAILWMALNGGIGIYSSVIAQAIQLLLTAAVIWHYARPHRTSGDLKGVCDRSIVREVFSFARDSMLWQIGGQTLASLPIILASAWFALGGAADLSGGMKLILLLVSITTRFGDMSVTPLAIQFSTGHESDAARQMTRITGVSSGIGVCAAIFLVCANPQFISWWMLGKISWAWDANVSCAVWVALVSVGQCIYAYAVISRQMQLIRWAMISECAMYLLLAYSTKEAAGLSCLLLAKPVAYFLILCYVAWKIKKHTLFDTFKLVPILLRQFAALAALVPVSLYASQKVLSVVHHPVLALVAVCLLSAVLACLASPLLFTREMRADIFRLAIGALGKFNRFKAPINPASP